MKQPTTRIGALLRAALFSLALCLACAFGATAADAAEKEPSAQAAPIASGLRFDLVLLLPEGAGLGPVHNATAAVLGRTPFVAKGKLPQGALRIGLWSYGQEEPLPSGGSGFWRNHTPEFVSLAKIVEHIDALPISVKDRKNYCVDLFGAVAAAATQSVWRSDSVRVMLLVGDAPACEPGHPDNLSQYHAGALRALLTEAKIIVIAIQLRNGKDAEAEKKQREQYAVLASNSGTDALPLYCLSSDDLAAYSGSLERITGALVSLHATAERGELGSALEFAPKTDR